MGPHASFFHRLAHISVLIFLIAPGIARAETEDPEQPRYRLDPVVVTPNRFPIRLDRVPADITVITPERLEAKRPLLLAEALREAPGVDVQRSGSTGKLTDVRLRGADPRHTLVLYDGIPLNGPWIGNFDFADFMGGGWNQVEVFGGPASSLYGSGAVGGVIQIRNAAETETPRRSLFAEYGEHATLRQGVSWRAPMGSSHAGLSLTRLTSHGRVARDAYSGVNGQLHLGIPIGGERLRVSALATQGTKELPFDFVFDGADTTLSPFGSLRQVRDPNNEEKDRLLAGSVAYERALGTRAAVEAELSGFAGQIENQNAPSSGDFQLTQLDNTRGIASIRGRYDAAPWAAAVIGGEYRGESVDRLDNFNSGGFAGASDVHEDISSRALYAQSHLEWRERAFLDAGIRLEDHSRFGSYGVPRVSLAVAVPRSGLRIRGGYGRAFTAPTLTDLFYPGYGSPTLKPERSRTWEAGLDGSWLEGRISARATWYSTRFRDLIQSNSFFVADNVGRARIEGEEYVVRGMPTPRVRVEARAAHLKSENLATGERLAKRPEWRAGGSIQAEAVTGVTALADFWWSASMLDPFVFIDVEGRVLSGDTPERASLDLGVNASLSRWIPADVRFRLDNALNRRYSDVKGFPALGRSFRVGLTLNP